MYIVELSDGLYLATWAGDPGRTYNLDSARRYRTEKGAKIALGLTRYMYGPYKAAQIVEV